MLGIVHCLYDPFRSDTVDGQKFAGKQKTVGTARDWELDDENP